jgi:hypothetical protein
MFVVVVLECSVDVMEELCVVSGAVVEDVEDVDEEAGGLYCWASARDPALTAIAANRVVTRMVIVCLPGVVIDLKLRDKLILVTP